MTDPQIPTLGRFDKGFPEHPDAPQAAYTALSAALTTTYPDDRHFAAYSLPDVPRRLAGERALELGPAMVLFVLDVEPEGHAEVTPEWFAAESERLNRLLTDHPGGYVYTTRGGYRVVYRISPFSLKTVTDKEQWSARYSAWLEHVAQTYGIQGDPRCKDWTRLYRLPRVVRDGVPQEPDTAGDPAAIGIWDVHVDVQVTEPKPAPVLDGDIPSGQRNNALTSLAGTMRNRGMGEEAILAALLVENAKRCNPPLDESDVHTIAASVARYAPGADIASSVQVQAMIDTIATSAEQDDDAWPKILAQAWADIQAYRGASGDGGGKVSSPAFSSAQDLFTEDFPATSWLVQGLVTEESVGVTSAEPKNCKTWAELEIALAVATGTLAFGEFEVPRRGHTALFLAEDHRRSVRNRLRALAAARGMDPVQAVERVHVACRKHLDITKDEDLVWIVASCRTIPGLLLVEIDPLRDVHSADENDSGGMSDVMGRLRLIRDVVGCSVRFVHHSAKSGEGNRGRRSGQKMRGSSAVHGAIDCGFYMDNLDTDEQSYWTSDVRVEIKAARGAGKFSLGLVIEDDEHGEAIRAAWNVERDTPERRREREEAQRKEDEAAVLAAVAQYGDLKWGDLRKMTGLGNDRAQEIRIDLEAQGKIRRVTKYDENHRKRAGDFFEVAVAAPKAPAVATSPITAFLK